MYKPFNIMDKLKKPSSENDEPMIDDEQLLIQHLLKLDMPSEHLTEDRLMFRKIFRNSKYTNEEMGRIGMSGRKQVSAFEAYTIVPVHESSGPKVLYMTPKNTNLNFGSEDEVLKDFEGHPIEKIMTSRVAEKVHAEKWRIEEEEMEKVRKARDTLRKAKLAGENEQDLYKIAKELSQQMMKPQEICLDKLIRAAEV